MDYIFRDILVFKIWGHFNSLKFYFIKTLFFDSILAYLKYIPNRFLLNEVLCSFRIL